MRRETAYKLAGRKHDVRVSGTGLDKVRRITFAEDPPWQCEQAFQSLRMLKALEVRALERPRTLEIRYSVVDHSLEMIEAALREAGFQLDNRLIVRLQRALIYYSEDTQRHNLLSPERLIKQSNQVFVKVYEQQVRGHDETPPELREYK